jgi:hypothetical protein
MCKKLIYVISFMLILAMSSSALAVPCNWTDLGGDDDWCNLLNWDTGTVPIITDQAEINGAYNVEVSCDATTFRTFLTQSAQLTVKSGGKLSVTNRGWIGHAPGSNCTVTVESGGELATNSGLIWMIGQSGGEGHVNILPGGIVNCGNLWVARHAGGASSLTYDAGLASGDQAGMVIGSAGDATVNMLSGTLNNTGDLYLTQTGGSANLNLFGGVLTCGDLLIGTGDINVVVTDGVLEMAAGQAGELIAAIGNGGITSPGTVYVEDDGVNTTMYAIDHAFNPVPAPYRRSGVPASTYVEFDLPDPNGAGTVTCDLVFSTSAVPILDPNDNLDVIDPNTSVIASGITGIATSSTDVTSYMVVLDTYTWQVVVSDTSPNTDTWYSPVYDFTYANMFPIALINGHYKHDSYIPDHWADEDQYLDIQLSGTDSYDPDGGSITYLWTFDNNVTTTPALLDGSTTSTSPTPVIRVSGFAVETPGSPSGYNDCSNAYWVRLVVNDGTDDSVNDALKNIWMHCSSVNWCRYADASTWIPSEHPADFVDGRPTLYHNLDISPENGVPDKYDRFDCIIGMHDFVELSLNWLADFSSLTD